jgi:broad specificity phosphatase PhoE
LALDVYLVRHGATEWTHTGQHTGRTDLPLLPEGEEQARRLGELLRDVEFTAAWSSDLARARRTAELAGFPDARVTALLREYDYGEYEGVTTADIHRERPEWDLFHDGAPGGESPAEAAARARAFLSGLDGAEGAVAVFSHGHFLRVVAIEWAGLDVAMGAHLGLDAAGVGVLHAGDRGRLIQRWNWVPDVTAAATH